MTQALISTVPPAWLSPTSHKALDLDGLLQTMKQVGIPRIHCFKDGSWFCVCEMHVAAAGAVFDIWSDYHIATPTAAAQQVAERIVATLNRWSTTPKEES